MSIRIIDATVLRANLGNAIDEVKRGNILEVRRRGKGEVALIDLSVLEDLLAVHEPEYLASIKQARAEAKSGKTVAFEDAYREVMGVSE